MRSNRDDHPSSSHNRKILGEAQINWLRNELIHSDATFKVIVAVPPSSIPPITPSISAMQNKSTTDYLKSSAESASPACFFISGGSYQGELTKLVHSSSHNLYDLSVGPLPPPRATAKTHSTTSGYPAPQPTNVNSP